MRSKPFCHQSCATQQTPHHGMTHQQHINTDVLIPTKWHNPDFPVSHYDVTHMSTSTPTSANMID